MNCLNLSITANFLQDEKELVANFLTFYKRLTRKQKAVWGCIRWFVKTFRIAFPCQSRIANLCKCCRETVINAIKKFHEHGWLGKRRDRHNQSFEYYIPECLKNIDIKDSKTWKNKGENPTPDSIRVNSPLKRCNSLEKNYQKTEGFGSSGHEKSVRNIPPEIQKLDLPHSAKNTLAFFGVPMVMKAVKASEDYQKTNKIWRLPGFIISKCKQYYNNF